MISEILKNKVFEKKPPVLIDVGASDEINNSWKKLSKYSICLGFDTNIQNNKSDTSYKKFYLIKGLISNKNEKKNFYFTFDKNCSSSLKPVNKDIKEYLFNKKFQIKKITKIKYMTLNRVLKNYKISYVDWFKTDTQGTDLRIFKNLNQSIKKRILIAEFEPGFENIYTKEDTVADVVKYMIKDFFIDSFKVKGDYFFSKKTKVKFLNKLQNRFFHLFNKKQIVWANITFINKLKGKFSKRDILLYIVIQIIRKNYIIALKICDQERKTIGDELYNYMIVNIKKEIQNKTFYLSIHLLKIITKKIFRILKF